MCLLTNFGLERYKNATLPSPSSWLPNVAIPGKGLVVIFNCSGSNFTEDRFNKFRTHKMFAAYGVQDLVLHKALHICFSSMLF